MPHAAHEHRTAQRDPGLAADGAALTDGPLRDALRTAMQHLSQAERAAGASRPAAMCQALIDAARALAGLQAYGPAESYLAQALLWARGMAGHDLRADLACALAEVAADAADLAAAQGQRERSRAARERGRDQAFEAARLAGLTADPGWEVRVLLRASDVLDRFGDHDDAVQMQRRALVLMGLGQAESRHDGNESDGWSGAETAAHTAPGALM